VINLGFMAAVVVSYVWVTAVAIDLDRRTWLDHREQASVKQ
jgi:hypothetical protein